MLLKRNQNDPFPKRVAAGDQKWIPYKKEQRNRAGLKRGARQLRPHQNWISTKRKCCCQHDGILKELCVHYET